MCYDDVVSDATRAGQGLRLGLIIALAAWTALAPPVLALTTWAMFDKATGSAAAGGYIVVGYGAAVVALAGCAILGLVAFVVAVVQRKRDPRLPWVAGIAAPVALLLELGIVLALLQRGHLL